MKIIEISPNKHLISLTCKKIYFIVHEQKHI